MVCRRGKKGRQSLLHAYSGRGARETRSDPLPPLGAQVLGTSLLEFFDAEMLSTHIASLRSADPMKTNLVLGLKQIDPSPDICKSCGEGKRTFEPPTVFCFSCGTRVKRNQVMFVAPAQAATVDNQRPVLCNGCFTQQRGECIHLEGINKVSGRGVQRGASACGGCVPGGASADLSAPATCVTTDQPGRRRGVPERDLVSTVLDGAGPGTAPNRKPTERT